MKDNLSIADKFLLGVCFSAIAGFVYLAYLGITYVDPCDKICSPGVNVRPANGICICATTIEIREKTND
jgi:hypothetical protein